ncbi:hypothetical protein MYX04_11210 [Nitrospiraceae bacterium AH_259_D15_M11_P09]|nr:hypothetical protein [Nitrospiraceae bacterium AH_259_D15_M11_P09]
MDFDTSRLAAERPLDIAPKDYEKAPKRKWYGNQMLGRMDDGRSAGADALAWAPLYPKLRADRELARFTPELQSLLPGFGMWWLRKLGPGVEEGRNGPVAQALSALTRAGISENERMEFLGTYHNTYWSVEAAFGRFLQTKYLDKTTENITQAGMSRKLQNLARKVGRLAVSPFFKQQAALSAQAGEAIQQYLKVYGHLARPVKDAARQAAVLTLVDWLLDRELSKNRAYQVVAALLGVTLDAVRHQYSYHEGK